MGQFFLADADQLVDGAAGESKSLLGLQGVLALTTECRLGLLLLKERLVRLLVRGE